ncbi:MAG: FtsX-like permease family protein [Thermoproteota archaeon]
MLSIIIGLKSLRRKGFILLLILLTLSFAIFVSINNAAYNLENIAKNAWNDYVGDVRISGIFNQDFINNLSESKHVQEYQALMIIPAEIYVNEDKRTAFLIYPKNNISLMSYKIKKGNYDGALVVEKEDINLGKIKIRVNNVEREINITGYASAFYVFGTVNYRIIINEDQLKEILGKVVYNLIFVKLKDKNYLKEFEEEIYNYANQTKSKIESFITLDPEAFPGKNETQAARNTFNLFIILFAIIIFVSFFVYQFIYLEMNSKELAVLNVVGFTKRNLFVYYSTPVFVIFIISVVIGYLISFPLSHYIFISSLRSVPLGFSEIFLEKFGYKFNNEIVLNNFLIFLIFLLFSILPIFIYIYRKNILELFSFYFTSRSKSKLSFPNLNFKISLNLTAGNLWKAILLVILFSLILTSTISANNIRDSWGSSIENLNSFYDYFLYALGNSNNLPEIKNASVWKAVFHFAKVKEKDVVVATFLINNGVMPNLKEGRWPTNAGECVISQTFSKTENIKLNDEIELEAGTNKYKLKVVGIAEIPLFFQYTRETRSVVLYYEDFKKLFGDPEENVIFLKGDYKPVYNELVNKGFVVTVRSKEESINYGKSGGAIAFVFLNFLSLSLILSNITLIGIILATNLSSRIREIGMLMLLGYTSRKIILIVIIFLLILIIISIPLAYFISTYFTAWNVNLMIEFIGYFEPEINIYVLFNSLTYTFLPLIVIFLILYIVIKRINLVKLLLG